jgi:hypothetical protein
MHILADLWLYRCDLPLAEVCCTAVVAHWRQKKYPCRFSHLPLEKAFLAVWSFSFLALLSGPNLCTSCIYVSQCNAMYTRDGLQDVLWVAVEDVDMI